MQPSLLVVVLPLKPKWLKRNILLNVTINSFIGYFNRIPPSSILSFPNHLSLGISYLLWCSQVVGVVVVYLVLFIGRSNRCKSILLIEVALVALSSALCK